MLKQVRESTITVMTTQFLDEAELLADTLVMVGDNRVLVSGSPQELKERYGSQFMVTLYCSNTESIQFV